MRALKDAAPLEISDIRTRAKKLAAMGRISDEDCDTVVIHCNELEALILGISETTDETERREF